jgi:hypothetical protein
MRSLVNIAATLCLSVLLSLLGYRAWTDFVQSRTALECQASLSRLRQEIKCRAGLETAPISPRGWPLTIAEPWFEDAPPRNPFLGGDRPWIEVASEDEALLTHPFVRCDVGGHFAEFWYNPFLGIIRARVPYCRTDRDTLDLYNTVNESDLASLFAAPPSPDPATMAIVESGVVPGDNAR